MRACDCPFLHLNSDEMFLSENNALWSLSASYMKSRFFFIPGVFLLVIGLGNYVVGYYKEQQYSRIIDELSVQQPRENFSMLSPLSRLEMEKSVSLRLTQRTEKANSRRELYHLFSIGGLAWVLCSILLFILGFIAKIRKVCGHASNGHDGQRPIRGD